MRLSINTFATSFRRKMELFSTIKNFVVFSFTINILSIDNGMQEGYSSFIGIKFLLLFLDVNIDFYFYYSYLNSCSY